MVQRRGAEFALTTIVKHFGGEMAVKLPHLWDAMVGPLRNTIDIHNFGVYIFSELRFKQQISVCIHYICLYKITMPVPVYPRPAGKFFFK